MAASLFLDWQLAVAILREFDDMSLIGHMHVFASYEDVVGVIHVWRFAELLWQQKIHWIFRYI